MTTAETVSDMMVEAETTVMCSGDDGRGHRWEHRWPLKLQKAQLGFSAQSPKETSLADAMTLAP